MSLPPDQCNLELDTGKPRSTALALPAERLPQMSSTITCELSEADSDIADDNTGFTTVTRRRKKRNHRDSSRSDSTIITNKPPISSALTVLYSPGDAVSVSSCNKLKLSELVNALTSGQITEIRVNQRRIIIAVDTTTRQAYATLLQQTGIWDQRPLNTK